ncbi:hypothetical protein AAW01_11155 [Aurantiacibacter gangjinensis]|uniref:Uncharacterized protein n=2 Tax=Aurantiacibacter gangjinensis TaxID=502682 RepID=A0A0G9MMY4_9SPHN|nr:hypothetical protein AAW01_11155 [Aurantiacibacter gangjinensis]
MRPLALAALVLLAGCSTERDILELQLGRLQYLESNAQQVQIGIDQGSYDPARYDAYLALDVDVFQRVFSEVEGQTIEIDAGGRPLEITVGTFSTNFRPGSPEITLAANAVDLQSGIEAGIEIDTRIVLVRDPDRPEELTARIIATRMVPDLRWGPLNFTKARFVRSLLELEASKFTDSLPGVVLPLAQDFAFGADAQVIDTGRISTGNGSYIRGNINVPTTLTTGRFAVQNILFLENGVHVFANVEGL